MPSVFVQGRPVDSYPRLAPEAGRGRVGRITEVGEEVLHKPCRDVTEGVEPPAREWRKAHVSRLATWR